MLIPQSPKPMRNPVPLHRVPDLSSSQITTLHEHWIISIQEFTALVALPSTRPPLARLLGLSVDALMEVGKTARQQLPALRGEEEDAALDQVTYAAGALEPPAAFRAEVTYERIPYEAPFPPALSYADELPPVRDQGARGTCVAFAAAAVREFLEIQHRKRQGRAIDPKKVDLSEQFIYWWCKEKDGLPQVSGTYPYLGLQCLLEVGAPPEKAWPYRPLPGPGPEGQGPPPPKALDAAAAYRIGRIVHLQPDDIDSMKAALVQGHSVMITIPIVDSWFRSRTTRLFGKINLPLPDEPSVGAHALALVGYVDDEDAPGGGYFVVRNAWKPWGLKNPLGPGLGTIPYGFLQKHNLLADLAEPLVTADVYIRDSEKDTGLVPSRGPVFDSPDIWVRHRRDDKEAHQPPIPGKKQWIYVRAWNLGPERATGVRAQVFTATASPSLWPDMWQPIGEVDLGDLEPKGSQVGSLAWTPDQTAQRLLVRLQSDQDPAQHQWAVRYDNNIAQKNRVHLAARPGKTATLAFPIYGPPGKLTLRYLRVDRRGLRRGRVGLALEKGDAYRGPRQPLVEDEVMRRLAQNAVASRTAVLTIKMPKAATPKDGGRLVVSQWHGKVLVGRMIVDVEVSGSATDADH